MAKLGKRQTAQRDSVQMVIQETDGPLTVDEIYERASEKIDSLGIATVYRALKLLLASGHVKSITLPDGKTRYEAADLRHHPHFQCRVCDGVYDLPECLVALPENSTLEGGFKVEDHELTLYGVCPHCKG